ncbi:hypothetical protein CR203_03520 [Salipaludibacillus neizhouensis]|uniref:Uncharacterized protein n=1 Tax=Salipaludibacillus neizhouensis TaxID=885475 RepID=A0A3A9K9E2_9BACI|nr:hypothetical protein [Salipaludibacillus neizhouensis]RKL69117.1 hypothetical protein CR203_03520 [Salipaludibacillus neizhouensis]
MPDTSEEEKNRVLNVARKNLRREFALKPLYTLFDIFGPGYIFNGKGSYQKQSMAYRYTISQNLSTGRLLTATGKTPLIIHKNVIAI